MGHDHSHHSHSHSHGDPREQALSRLMWSLVITGIAMVIEFVGGWISGSLALISDAGHMLTHAVALAIGITGAWFARQPRCHHRTFGLLRTEVVAAFVNAIFLLAASVWIVVESVHRFADPVNVLASRMLVIAVFGLVVNGVSILLLHGSRKSDMNVRAVVLHMFADAASSVAIVGAAVVIRYTNWVWLDPAISCLIAVLIAWWAGGLLKDSLRVLLEMAPPGQDVHTIAGRLRERFPRVAGTDREHLWTIAPGVSVFTAHLQVHRGDVETSEVNPWLDDIAHWLHEEFEINETTLQVVWEPPGKS